MASNLPIEIIVEEILPKLPAKSLLRFKCVSKPYKTLISSPNFISRHLRHSLSTASNRHVIISLVGDGGGLHIVDLDSPQLPLSPLRLPDDFRSITGKCTLASSNGLLLVTHTELSENLIVNPFTGFYTSFRRGFNFELGFGYDPISNDYKLLFLETGSFMIYSLMNGSSHCILGDELVTLMIEEIFTNRKFAVVVNHCLCHWLVWCPLQNKHRIFCLDFSTEKWTLDVPLPKYETLCSGSASGSSLPFADLLFETCRDKKSDVINLAVFEGYLSVSTRNLTFLGSFDVWVMKVYGVAESWVKLFSISDEWSVPLCYSTTSKSRVLVRKRSGGRRSRLIWYNVSHERFENPEILGAHGVGGLYDACVFTGSLVMVPHGRRIHQDE